MRKNGAIGFLAILMSFCIFSIMAMGVDLKTARRIDQENPKTQGRNHPNKTLPPYES